MRFRRFCIALLLCSLGLLMLNRLSVSLEKRSYPLRYRQEVERYGTLYGVPPSVIYAVIRVESSFDPHAVSPAGAYGLMQLTEDTFLWIRGKIGTEEDRIFDPETNIQYGVYYLSYLYGRFGDWDTAFAAYNAGPNRVAGWLDGEGRLSEIPFPETREYLIRVRQAIMKYEKLYF